jgi:DNA invertase Pin-like site-specific DNA recombinase
LLKLCRRPHRRDRDEHGPAVSAARRPEREEDVMAPLLIGYARVSTDEQDVTAQCEALATLGVSGERIYVDHGLTGSNRDRPGLREALAACRDGDTLVVTKLDRLARSLPDARDIVDDLSRRHVKLSLDGSPHDPNDPVGRLLFNVLAMVAEFEADLIRLRTREGMRVANAKGRLRGEQPKLSPMQEAHLVELNRGAEHTVGELEERLRCRALDGLSRHQRDQRRRQTGPAGGRATASTVR